MKYALIKTAIRAKSTNCRCFSNGIFCYSHRFATGIIYR